MKKVLPIVLALGLVFVFNGCSRGELKEVDPASTKSPYLHVVTSSWSGWSSDYKPEEVDYYFEVQKGCGYGFPEVIGHEVAFTIVGVGESGITIRFNEELSVLKDGKINLSGFTNTYDVAFGETVEVVTPSMDEGAIYTFTLQKG